VNHAIPQWEGHTERDMDTVQNLMPLMLFFFVVYRFFKWVVRDMNRSADR
jgi:hypothetical protein